MPTDITRFYTYDDLTGILRGHVRDFPNLTTLESLGQSFEGRDIWLLAITNQATGPADEAEPVPSDEAHIEVAVE